MTSVISANYLNRLPAVTGRDSFGNQNTGTHLTDQYSLGNTDLSSDDVTLRLIDQSIFCDRLIDYGKNPIFTTLVLSLFD
jgi:hypothetical protein